MFAAAEGQGQLTVNVVDDLTENDDMCQKDPCQNIARAMINTCIPVGDSDFKCSCQAAFTWDDDSNSCADAQVQGQIYWP